MTECERAKKIFGFGKKFQDKDNNNLGYGIKNTHTFKYFPEPLTSNVAEYSAVPAALLATHFIRPRWKASRYSIFSVLVRELSLVMVKLRSPETIGCELIVQRMSIGRSPLVTMH